QQQQQQQQHRQQQQQQQQQHDEYHPHSDFSRRKRSSLADAEAFSATSAGESGGETSGAESGADISRRRRGSGVPGAGESLPASTIQERRETAEKEKIDRRLRARMKHVPLYVPRLKRVFKAAKKKEHVILNKYNEEEETRKLRALAKEHSAALGLEA